MRPGCNRTSLRLALGLVYGAFRAEARKKRAKAPIYAFTHFSFCKAA
ncbi:hypothetical protein MCEMIH15_02954 [Caulobacteraceae bacterium]